jgi:hypothetical protein
LNVIPLVGEPRFAKALAVSRLFAAPTSRPLITAPNQPPTVSSLSVDRYSSVAASLVNLVLTFGGGNTVRRKQGRMAAR